MTTAGTGPSAVTVLGVEVRPDGDDDHELVVRGEAPEQRPCPIYEATLRVALTAPLECGRPQPGATEEAARLLLGAERPPSWWKRWPSSGKEKTKGRGGTSKDEQKVRSRARF